jgi:hypothetical protein
MELDQDMFNDLDMHTVGRQTSDRRANQNKTQDHFSGGDNFDKINVMSPSPQKTEEIAALFQPKSQISKEKETTNK